MEFKLTYKNLQPGMRVKLGKFTTEWNNPFSGKVGTIKSKLSTNSGHEIYVIVDGMRDEQMGHFAVQIRNIKEIIS